MLRCRPAPRDCAWQAPSALEQVHDLQSPSSAAPHGHCWRGVAHRVTVQHSRGRAPSCMSSPGERSPKHCKKSHFKGSALSLPADALAVSIRPPAPWGGLTSAASGAAPAAQRLSLSARQGREPAGAPVLLSCKAPTQPGYPLQKPGSHALYQALRRGSLTSKAHKRQMACYCTWDAQVWWHPGKPFQTTFKKMRSSHSCKLRVLECPKVASSSA